MIRVLHLFSRQPTFETEHGVDLLTDPTLNPFQSATLTIGRGGNFRSVLGAGATLRFGHAGFDLIHAWDPPAFIAAVGSGLPVVFSPPGTVKRGTWSWLATVAYGDVHVVSSTAWACRQQVSAGLSTDRCHVILPGIAAPARTPKLDLELRAALGISDCDFVILAPGESSRAARHRIAWHAAAILGELDARFRLLTWGRGPEARHFQSLSKRIRQSELSIHAEQKLGHDVSFEQLTGAADAALVTGSSDASLLPIAACAAAGLPIIAVDSAAVRETLHGDSISMVARKDVRTLSQRLLELRDDPDLRRQLGNAARARACQIFDPQRFVHDFSQLYQRIADRHRSARAEPLIPSQPIKPTALTRV